MPATSSSAPRVAVLADSDTRWKWGALTARLLAPGGEPGGYLLRGRATPTARQLAATGVVPATPAREVTLAGLAGELAGGAPEDGRLPTPDVLVLACVGHTVQAALHALAHRWSTTGHRPVLVTGYPGVVYEKLTEGLLLRHGADLVLAAGTHDADRFRAVLRGSGADDDAVAVAPLPFLGGTRHDPAAVARGDRPYRVVFATQPSVPARRDEREYLLRRAAAHALRHPEREVVVKLRSAPGEHTTHLEEIPYQRLAARAARPLPANLRLAGGPMGELLDTTDLLVTVSSTAALEALARSVPTAVLTDLGVREPLGNHWFTGSGCLTSWDQLDAGELPTPDRAWLAARGVPTGASDGSLADLVSAAYQPVRGRLTALTRRAADGGLAPPAPYYTTRRAPGYLPPLLARHGLDPGGAPLPGRTAAAGDAAPGPVRRLAHRTARRAYRAGTQRVAPAIRRWGQL